MIQIIIISMVGSGFLLSQGILKVICLEHNVQWDDVIWDQTYVYFDEEI